MEFIEISLKAGQIASQQTKKIEEGRWHHWSRVALLETDTHKAVVVMNIFERAVDLIVKTVSLGYFSYVRFSLEREIACFGALRVLANLNGSPPSPAPAPIPAVVSVESGASSSSGLSPERLAALTAGLQAYLSKKPFPPTYLRERYSSFEEYQQEREALKAPADLIVGRGTRIWEGSPKLNDFRKVGREEKPYHPFTIDCSQGERPDLCFSILQKEWPGIPDNSIDEIYLERIYPNPWDNMQLYYNAFRALKVGGTLIIDWNDGEKSEEHRNGQIQQINDKLGRLGIDLPACLAEPNEYSRSDLKGFPKFVCRKGCGEILKKLTPSLLMRETISLKDALKMLAQRFSSKDRNSQIIRR